MWEIVRKKASTVPDGPLEPRALLNGGGVDCLPATGRGSLAVTLSAASAAPKTIIVPRNFKRTVSVGGTVRFEPTIDEEAKIRDYRDLWSAV